MSKSLDSGSRGTGAACYLAGRPMGASPEPAQSGREWNWDGRIEAKQGRMLQAD